MTIEEGRAGSSLALRELSWVQAHRGLGDHVGPGVVMSNRVAGAGKRVCLYAPANPRVGAWNGQDLVCQALQLSDLCRRLTAQGPLPATPQPWGPVLPADQESGAGTGLSRELVYRTMPQGGAQVRHSLAITFWVLGGPVIRFQNPA